MLGYTCTWYVSPTREKENQLAFHRLSRHHLDGRFSTLLFNRTVSCCCFCRCGNNYGWARLEGNRCEDENEGTFGPCADADRTGFTPPMFEYCHADYYADTAEEAEFVAGVDICGDRIVTGNSVIGERGYHFQLVFPLSCRLRKKLSALANYSLM